MLLITDEKPNSVLVKKLCWCWANSFKHTTGPESSVQPVEAPDYTTVLITQPVDIGGQSRNIAGVRAPDHTLQGSL